jgi:hypothetical protein
MKKIVVYLLLICLGAACVQKTQVPADVLSQDKMRQVLTDIHLAEAEIAQSAYYNYDTSIAVYQRMEKAIFKKYKIDTVLYNRSYKFYAQNPELLDEVYVAMIDSLTYKEKILKAKNAANTPEGKLKQKMDSLEKSVKKSSRFEQNQ